MASMRQIPDQSAWRIARCPVVFQECIQNFGILFPPTGEWIGADIRVAILLADTTDSMPAAPCYTVTVLFFRYSNFSSNNSIFRTMPGQKANHMIVYFTKSYGKKRVLFKNVRRYHWLKYCAWVPVFLPLRTRSTPMMGNFFWRISDGRETAFVGISACARYEERF